MIQMDFVYIGTTNIVIILIYVFNILYLEYTKLKIFNLQNDSHFRKWFSKGPLEK